MLRSRMMFSTVAILSVIAASWYLSSVATTRTMQFVYGFRLATPIEAAMNSGAGCSPGTNFRCQAGGATSACQTATPSPETACGSLGTVACLAGASCFICTSAGAFTACKQFPSASCGGNNATTNCGLSSTSGCIIPPLTGVCTCPGIYSPTGNPCPQSNCKSCC
jgi:hypothetical protein